jgi:hypothetical protein
LAGVVALQQAVAGKPAQHSAAYLLAENNNLFWRQCRGLPELDRSLFLNTTSRMQQWWWRWRLREAPKR